MQDVQIKNDSVDETGRRARNVFVRVLLEKMQKMRSRQQIEQIGNVVLLNVGHCKEGNVNDRSKSGLRIPVVTVFRP